MTNLEMVAMALNRAAVREEEPSTLVGATGIIKDFVNWVADAWYELQIQKTNPPWWFRLSLDQTFNTVASTDQYAIPSGLETIDWRTVSIYTTAKTDEVPLSYVEYLDWRMCRDTKTTTEARPTEITVRPDDVIQVWPVPDQVYTIRFDGVNDIDELSGDADTPTGLPEQYHRVLVWDAVRRYAINHEDGAKLADADDKHRRIYDRMVAKQLPPMKIDASQISGRRTNIY